MLNKDSLRKEKLRVREVAEMYKKELEMCDENRKRFQNEIIVSKIKVRDDFRANMAILQHKH